MRDHARPQGDKHMRVRNTVGALLVAAVPLIVPAAANASHLSQARPANEPGAFAPSRVSTLGDSQQAVLLNAATTARTVTLRYRGEDLASGDVDGVEVAGVQAPGDANDLPHTVSTSGSPDQAALLNAATMLSAPYR
jgi:hypothetical protein